MLYHIFKSMKKKKEFVSVIIYSEDKMHSVIRELIKWNRLFSTIITSILSSCNGSSCIKTTNTGLCWILIENILNPAFSFIQLQLRNLSIIHCFKMISDCKQWGNLEWGKRLQISQQRKDRLNYPHFSRNFAAINVKYNHHFSRI